MPDRKLSLPDDHTTQYSEVISPADRRPRIVRWLRWLDEATDPGAQGFWQ